MVLTVVTVARLVPAPAGPGGRSRSPWSIATVKGALVAGYFMHLISERKLIYWVLGFTVVLLLRRCCCCRCDDLDRRSELSELRCAM